MLGLLLCFRDHVQWTDEERERAQQKAEENSKHKIPAEEQRMYLNPNIHQIC